VLLEAVVRLGNQAEVSKELRVDQATVSRWLSGKQGMDVGACLRLAKLTQTKASDILRWANHDPDEYLQSGNLPPLSSDALAVDQRVRILGWERKRNLLPTSVRPIVDSAVDAVLNSYLRVAEQIPPVTSAPSKPRRRRSTDV
jgi:transcriptional regulator with XRE-family HTH domain